MITEKIREYQKQWRTANKEKIRKYLREYKIKNNDELKRKQRLDFKNNKKKYRAWSQQYRDKHKEKFYMARKKSKSFSFSNYKYNASRRGYAFCLTFDEFIFFWQKPCNYCSAQIETIGIDRVDNSIGYEIGNVVPCCKVCNRGKDTLSREEFIGWCRRVAMKHPVVING